MKKIPEYTTPQNFRCPECGELCKIVPLLNEFSFSGTHCTHSLDGTHYPDSMEKIIMGNTNLLYVDLETCPSQSPTIKEEILAELKIPGSISKQETIAKWYKEKAPAIAKEQYLKTSLNPMHGSIISIAYAFNEKPVEGIIRKIDEPEKNLLEAFYEVLLDSDTDYLQWVAFPIRFDLPFLLKRSIINSIRPPVGIPNERSKSAFCPMNYWAGWHEFCSLDSLCKTMGIPGKDGMTGKDVWPAVQRGEYEKILAYNKSDVEMLRQVFRRIHFLDWTPSDTEKEIKIANEEDEKLEKAGFFDIQEKGKL